MARCSGATIRKNGCTRVTLVTCSRSRNNWFFAAIADKPVPFTSALNENAVRPLASWFSMNRAAAPSSRCFCVRFFTIIFAIYSVFRFILQTKSKTSGKVLFCACKYQGINKMERVKGIEPSSQAWEARILPLNHTRLRCNGLFSRNRGSLQLDS